MPADEPLSDENAAAIKAWNLLSNGMGGIDWAGLGFVAELLGVSDLEALADALLCIRTRPTGRDDSENETD